MLEGSVMCGGTLGYKSGELNMVCDGRKLLVYPHGYNS